MAQPFRNDEEEEPVGCMDLAAAFAGFGCAMVVRLAIIGGAFVILFLVFHVLLGWG